VIATLLILGAAHLAIGLLFAGPFVLKGVERVDAHAAHASWGFRLLIVPGTMLLWPVLARRWWNGDGHPPAERNAHRSAGQGPTGEGGTSKSRAMPGAPAGRKSS
jgi:hypothetical protein